MKLLNERPQKDGLSTKYVCGLKVTGGDMEPDCQIGFHEWYNRYVSWLENQVEKQRSLK